MYKWWNLNTLSFRSEINLIFGAILDIVFTYVAILFFETVTGTYLANSLVGVLVLLIAGLKFLWSINFFQNHVPTYKMGIVTFMEKIVPSGPTGTGLLPGYYWFPLGWPFYKLFVTQSVLEFTIPFERMKVWTQNSAVGEQGGVAGT